VSRPRWLTPDAPGDGFICRRLLIPNGLDWLSIVTGALNELIYEYNFEEFGTDSPADTAAAFQLMFDHFCFDDDPGCRLIGEIVTFAGPTNPSANFLPCDGASLPRSDYPDLFSVIGITYGSADSTHFNVPNLTGRVVSGSGSTSGLSTHSLGQTYGSESITLGIGDVPSHTHSDFGHSHAEGTAAPSVGAAITGIPVPSAIPSVGVTGLGNASLSTVGGDGAHDNQQPTIALNYFIVAL